VSRSTAGAADAVASTRSAGQPWAGSGAAGAPAPGSAPGPLPADGLAAVLADRLRAAICSGQLAPGDRLVERRLAREFGVSHIPLREALARLVEEGLVVRPPRRGARVARLSPVMLEEISSLRVVLEQLVIRRLRTRFTAPAQARLQGIVDRMMQAADQRDLVRVHELDQLFHEQLWQLADHALLAEMAAQMRSRINHVIRAAAATLGRDELRRHAERHQVLLDVIASGDVGAAQQEMESHILRATQRIAEAQLVRPDDD
jgi:DNA-binding GntR family transcriptional regulator